MRAIRPELPDSLKGIKPRRALFYEVADAQLSARRQSAGHTKTRDEVSGGGRKPWRQKGTGRARSGSSRSPVWTGGGVTFGPRNERDYRKNLPRKKRQKAALEAVIQRLNEDNLRVADELMPEQPKTRLAAEILSEIFPGKEAKTLILTEGSDAGIRRVYGNIRNVSVKRRQDLNLLMILSHERVLFTSSAWDGFLKERAGGKEE